VVGEILEAGVNSGAVAASIAAQEEATVEIQVTISSEEWQKRLEDIARRLATPMEKLCKILFCRAIATFEKITLEEYDRLTEELDSQSHMNAISIPEMEVKVEVESKN